MQRGTHRALGRASLAYLTRKACVSPRWEGPLAANQGGIPCRCVTRISVPRSITIRWRLWRAGRRHSLSLMSGHRLLLASQDPSASVIALMEWGTECKVGLPRQVVPNCNAKSSGKTYPEAKAPLLAEANRG